jgi:hypothetical protein
MEAREVVAVEVHTQAEPTLPVALMAAAQDYLVVMQAMAGQILAVAAAEVMVEHL